jgi:hypothetical protein
MADIKVFLSVGRSSTDEQEDFIKSLEIFLQSNDLIPQTVGRTVFSSEQPLKPILRTLKECSGTVIAAFERTRLVDAIDRRGSSNPVEIKDMKLPTVWNQIEATMAYTIGHPLFVLVEQGVKSEGLLEKGYDWYVKWVDVDKLGRLKLVDPEFLGVFADWKKRVEAFHADLAKTQDETKAGANVGVDRWSLYNNLVELFSDSEIDEVCFAMKIDEEALKRETKPTKARELIRFCERRSELGELVDFCRKQRPQGQW